MAGQEIRRLIDRFGRENVVVELTCRGHPTDDEDNDELAVLATTLGLQVVATTGAHYAGPPGSGWVRRWPRSAPGAAWTRPIPTCRPGPGRTCGPAPRWRSCSPGTRLRCRMPREIGRECAFDLKLVAPQPATVRRAAGNDENTSPARP